MTRLSRVTRQWDERIRERENCSTEKLKMPAPPRRLIVKRPGLFPSFSCVRFDRLALTWIPTVFSEREAERRMGSSERPWGGWITRAPPDLSARPQTIGMKTDPQHKHAHAERKQPFKYRAYRVVRAFFHRPISSRRLYRFYSRFNFCWSILKWLIKSFSTRSLFFLNINLKLFFIWVLKKMIPFNLSSSK